MYLCTLRGKDVRGIREDSGCRGGVVYEGSRGEILEREWGFSYDDNERIRGGGAEEQRQSPGLPCGEYKEKENGSGVMARAFYQVPFLPPPVRAVYT